jgi:hypothetical protein
VKGAISSMVPFAALRVTTGHRYDTVTFFAIP